MTTRKIAAATVTIGGIWILAKLLSPKPAPPVINKKNLPNRKYNYPAGWKGTPTDKKGRYVNHEHPYYQNYLDIIRFIPGNIYSLLVNACKRKRVLKHDDNSFLEKDNILIWLGHASFYLQVAGKRIIIDPQFHNTSVYFRHSKSPMDPAFFTGIDYILISHDHADHLDRRSLSTLVKNNPGAKILTGLGMERLITKYTNIDKRQLYCADWFEVYPLTDSSLDITYVPSRHYSNRVDSSFNKSLWGGFIFCGAIDNDRNKTIYFAGDSGVGNHFSMIAQFKPDLAIMGIGAYKPSWLMIPNHTSPKEAVEAFRQTGAHELIPMHYGTFNLGFESTNEPLNELRKYTADVNVKIAEIGEIIRL